MPSGGSEDDDAQSSPSLSISRSELEKAAASPLPGSAAAEEYLSSVVPAFERPSSRRMPAVRMLVH